MAGALKREADLVAAAAGAAGDQPEAVAALQNALSGLGEAYVAFGRAILAIDVTKAAAAGPAAGEAGKKKKVKVPPRASCSAVPYAGCPCLRCAVRPGCCPRARTASPAATPPPPPDRGRGRTAAERGTRVRGPVDCLCAASLPPDPTRGAFCARQPAKDKADKEKRKPTAYNLFVKAESGNLRKADNQATQQVCASVQLARAVRARALAHLDAGHAVRACSDTIARRGVRADPPRAACAQSAVRSSPARELSGEGPEVQRLRATPRRVLAPCPSGTMLAGAQTSRAAG